MIFSGPSEVIISVCTVSERTFFWSCRYLKDTRFKLTDFGGQVNQSRYLSQVPLSSSVIPNFPCLLLGNTSRWTLVKFFYFSFKVNIF